MLGELTQWATPSLGGLLGIGVLLILTGKLVPVSTLRREVDQERRRGDFLEKANEKQGEQLDRALDALRTTEAALDALKRAAERGRR